MLLRLLALALVAFLPGRPAFGADPPKKILLIASPPDDHPPTTHEYKPGLGVLLKCLKPVREVEVTLVTAEGPWKDGPELIGRADCAVIFLTEGAKWLSADEKRLAAFKQLAARGGGLIVLHWGMGTREAGPVDAFVALFGGCHGGPDRKYQILETTIAIADPKHSITTGIKDFTIKDEFYYKLKFPKPTAGVKPVLQATIDGNKETVAWAWERPDGGRSFGFSGLHFHDNWKRIEYRRVVAQAVLWSVKLPVPEGGLSVDLADVDFQLPKQK